MVKMLRTDQMLSPYCWLSTLRPTRGAYFHRAALILDGFGLDVRCRRCTSKGMHELANYSRSRVDLVEQGLQYAFGQLAEIIEGDGVRDFVDQMVLEAPRKCELASGAALPVAPDAAQSAIVAPVDDSTGWMMPAAATVGGLIVFFCCWCCVARCRFYNSLKKSHVARARAEASRDFRKQVAEGSCSLARSPVVSWCAFLGVPLCLIGNTFLFVSGHLSLGATVDLDLGIFSEPLSLLPLVEFSMAGSIADMIKAKAYALAGLIIFFSVFWPYFKIAVTLMMWYLPPCCLTPSTRGSTLSWLDALGKWSMVDIFVMIVTLAAFRHTVLLPEGVAALLPNEFITVDLTVRPVWGLYSNTLAQVVCQLISHWIVYLHRNACAYAAHTEREYILTEATRRHKSRCSNAPQHQRPTGLTHNGLTPPPNFGSPPPSPPSHYPPAWPYPPGPNPVPRNLNERGSIKVPRGSVASSGPDVRGSLAVSSLSDGGYLRSSLAGSTGGGGGGDRRGSLASSSGGYDRRGSLASSGLANADLGSSSVALVVHGGGGGGQHPGRDSRLIGSMTRPRAPTWLEMGTVDVYRGGELGEHGGGGPEGDVWKRMERERLCDHVFELTSPTGPRKFRFNACGKCAIFLLLLATALAFLIGATAPSFRMKSMGIVGKVLDMSGRSGIDAGSYDRPFSIFSVTGFVSSQAGDGLGSQLGLRFMTSLFVFCSFVVPVLQTLTLATLWWRRMSLIAQKRVLMMNEILSAWQYLEV